MTADIKRQLAAHGANVPAKRTSGRGAADSATSAKKPAKKDHSDELANPQMQAARAEVVGPARLAWVNTTFGFPLHCRKYQLLDARHGEAMDAEYHRLTNTTP